MFKTPKFTNMLNSIIKEKSSENLSGNADDELPVQNNQINVSSRFTSFSEHPQLLKLRTMQSLASTFNVGDPFFSMILLPVRLLILTAGSISIIPVTITWE